MLFLGGYLIGVTAGCSVPVVVIIGAPRAREAVSKLSSFSLDSVSLATSAYRTYCSLGTVSGTGCITVIDVINEAVSTKRAELISGCANHTTFTDVVVGCLALARCEGCNMSIRLHVEVVNVTELGDCLCSCSRTVNTGIGHNTRCRFCGSEGDLTLIPVVASHAVQHICMRAGSYMPVIVLVGRPLFSVGVRSDRTNVGYGVC